MANRIDIKAAHTVFFLAIIVRTAAAQQCTDARKQLHHAEWLWNIVVCSDIQSSDDIVLASFCGQHNNRQTFGRRCCTQFLQNGKAVLFRQHDIQQYQRGRLFMDSIPELAWCSKAFCLHVLSIECVNNQFTNAFIIFQHINHFSSPQYVLYHKSW